MLGLPTPQGLGDVRVPQGADETQPGAVQIDVEPAPVEGL